MELCQVVYLGILSRTSFVKLLGISMTQLISWPIFAGICFFFFLSWGVYHKQIIHEGALQKARLKAKKIKNKKTRTHSQKKTKKPTDRKIETKIGNQAWSYKTKNDWIHISDETHKFSSIQQLLKSQPIWNVLEVAFKRF